MKRLFSSTTFITALMLSFGLVAGEAVAQQECPYASVQARVQKSTQDPWTQSMGILQGESFRVGAFQNGWGMFVDCCTTLTLTGPRGYVASPANNSAITVPHPGTYTLQVSCGSVSETATVTVTAVPGAHAGRRFHFGIGVSWGNWHFSRRDQQLAWDRASMDKIAEAGGTAMNPSFAWGDIERTRGVYDWSYVDHQVEEAQKRGLEMFAYAGLTPDWALPIEQRGQGHRFPPSSTYTTDFQNFFRTLAQRYCGRVKYYWFWNEPNGCGWTQAGCANSGQAASYAVWLQRWYTAMKEGCADTVLSVGGLDCNLSTGATGCANYIRDLYNAGAGNSFDAVTLHPYGDNTSANALNWASIQAVANELAARGHSSKRLWLDEWGFNTTDETLKRTLVREVLDKLALPEYSSVFQARYLILTDLPPSSTRPYQHDYGLAAGDLATLTITPRSSWSGFRSRALGNVTRILLANPGMEYVTTPELGAIDSWGPHAGWASHNNLSYRATGRGMLGRKLGFYSAGSTTQNVSQMTSARFAPSTTYQFRSIAQGGSDDTGVIPYRIGYAAVDGDESSFVPLATGLVTVGAAWADTVGVSYTTGTTGPELGKQIIVRLGNTYTGGVSDVWIDNLLLISTP